MHAAPTRRRRPVLAASLALLLLGLLGAPPGLAGRFNAALQEEYLAGQVRLGRKYYRGDGVPRDDSMALRCFREAAEGGNPEGQFLLGVLYAEGHAVPQDYAEAARWYRKAADGGHGTAGYNLATLYAGGLGLPRDPGEALRWYRRAADAGHPAARYRVGAAFEAGEGVARNLKLAAGWYRKAAEGGNAEACARLGALHAQGRGVPKKPAEALRWYRRAADLGSADAWFALGGLHENGTGVRRDEAEALRWYRLAASAGHPQARNEASRLVESRGEPRLLGLSLAGTTRREMRAVLGKLGARPIREDDRYWYDTYDGTAVLPGSGELVAGYTDRGGRLAVLRCTFPVTLDAPSVEELAEAIEGKYGPADFERGSAARGLAEYRWDIGNVTVTLQRARTDGPVHLTYEVAGVRRILDAEMGRRNAGRSAGAASARN